MSLPHSITSQRVVWLNGLLEADGLAVSLSHRLVFQRSILGRPIIYSSTVTINARGPLPPAYQATLHNTEGSRLDPHRIFSATQAPLRGQTGLHQGLSPSFFLLIGDTSPGLFPIIRSDLGPYQWPRPWPHHLTSLLSLHCPIAATPPFDNH